MRLGFGEHFTNSTSTSRLIRTAAGVLRLKPERFIGEPSFAGQIDPSEHYYDDIPEGGDVPDEIATAFQALNEAIKACATPLCWWPGKFAASDASVSIALPGAANT
jgi:hypothetical protein